MAMIYLRVSEQTRQQFESLSEDQRAEIEALVAETIHKMTIQNMLALMTEIGDKRNETD